MAYVKMTGMNFKPNPKPEPRPKKKKGQIPRISAKRREENKEYKTLREVFLNGKICPVTGQRATEVHHTYSGKDRATHFLDVKTWLAVSRDGHNWIHNFPKEARELGYLK